MRRRAALALVGLALGGCARVLPEQAAAHGNLLAHAEPGRRAPSSHARASIVLFEHGGVRAIDPVDARTQWYLPLEVTGHPVADEGSVYLPVSGHRVVAVDRETGTPRWSVALPGEALAGLAVGGPWLVASVIGARRGHRAAIVGLSTHEGHVRWQRAVDHAVGVPAVGGDVAVVPLGRDAVALRLSSGRELARARLALPGSAASQRVIHQGRAWFVGGGTRWVELGHGGRAHELRGAVAPVFPEHAAVDAGHGDDERLRLWFDLGERALGRDAILLSRRAVIAMRVGPDGAPQRSRWAHLEDAGEFVAMQVAGERVVLVREDGGIVTLSRASGREIDRIAGGEPVRGAMVLVPDRVARGHADEPESGRDVIADLHAIVRDADPRLLPAQRLAAELLWRDDQAEVRAAVLALARGQVRGEQTAAAEALRDHAAALAQGRWGGGTDADVLAVVEALRQRPRFGADDDGRAGAIRQAAHSGRPEVVEALGALLLDPGTPAAELVEVVQTLAQLRDPAAVPPLSTFLRRYHADQAVAYESSALRGAAALLVELAAGEGDDARAARAALQEVAADPLCEPSLRAFIHAQLAARRVPATDTHEQAPVLSARL
ncbi:MAG: PQQ-like beta-propeller repeat protein [Nannocystaceae bacterium]|nr:PQQ-like beta-propeller repeat protein [Nannocystaceae bacterium]